MQSAGAAIAGRRGAVETPEKRSGRLEAFRQITWVFARGFARYLFCTLRGAGGLIPSGSRTALRQH